MKIYFHELTDDQRKKIFESNITIEKVEEMYSQPEWCNYPNALAGLLGCWSLVKVNTPVSKEYCKTCEECNISKLINIEVPMKKKNGVNFSLAQKATKRRQSALSRIEASLLANSKTVKGTVNDKQPLTESDVKRMEKEIANLKAKLSRA